jgi:hypothetical protein
MSSHQLVTSADISRLPLKQIEAALRKTTEVLATELAAPTSSAPDWTDFEWCIARSAAAMHGISPLLSSTLRWRGPESWECFLREQRNHTFLRHQRIARLLADIGARAVRDGIAIVPLKGAALHEIGLYRPGERPMADIDLLVKNTDAQAAARLLGACGYHGTFTMWKHRIFEPDATIGPTGLGEHAHNPIKIDLHVKVAERLPFVDRDISALVFPPQPVAGLNAYPSLSSLMIHLLMHAAGNMCVKGIRLLQLHDIALLSRRMTGSDWEAVLPEGIGETFSWMLPPLALTARYYPGAIPARAIARAESKCSWLLRRFGCGQALSDVSLSNLRMQAFPGIEWSHSAQEAFGYVVNRVKPDPETVAVRKEAVKTYPNSASFSWPHLSHWQRVVCWVFYRQPRMATLSSVYTALAQLATRP